MHSATQGYVDDALARIPEGEPTLLIGGEWHAPRSGGVRETVDPSTGQVIAPYAIAGHEDLALAVAAATAAPRSWAQLSVAERAESFARLSELIAERADEIANLDAPDVGLSVGRMDPDMRGALRALNGWPGLASALRGEVMPDPSTLHHTRYAPYGVAAKIVAYNHPILFAVKGSLAALIAGNPVVLQPADQTPLSALVLGELVQEAFPPGVMSILTGEAETGSALTADARRIAFTGSSRTGALIQRSTTADDTIRTLSLELGGKNALVVLPDVDVPQVATEVVRAMNLRANQGQSCGSTSRIFVHRDIYDDVCAHLATVFGPAYDPASGTGPLISAEHADRVRTTVAVAVSAGADGRSGRSPCPLGGALPRAHGTDGRPPVHGADGRPPVHGADIGRQGRGRVSVGQRQHDPVLGHALRRLEEQRRGARGEHGQVARLPAGQECPCRLDRAGRTGCRGGSEQPVRMRSAPCA